MDKSASVVSLLAMTTAGAVYTLNTLLPIRYLQDCEIPENDDTIFLSRSTSGGIAGITASCYLAANSGKEAQDIILKSFLVANCIWFGSNLIHANKKKGGNMVYANIATNLFLGGLVLYALGRK
eukprot:gb/GEZN01028759.1/.p1 GENE.gb/GEZN01028759.1/~~gb/GEZN01028759.1/.p1  ORF type:complete len:124 (+),score=15.91 gb/GEZN01028759.1/:25-396(+)